MESKIKVQETVNMDFNFFQAVFAPPVEVAPMARAGPDLADARPWVNPLVRPPVSC